MALLLPLLLSLLPFLPNPSPSSFSRLSGISPSTSRISHISSAIHQLSKLLCDRCLLIAVALPKTESSELSSTLDRLRPTIENASTTPLDLLWTPASALRQSSSFSTSPGKNDRNNCSPFPRWHFPPCIIYIIHFNIDILLRQDVRLGNEPRNKLRL